MFCYDIISHLILREWIMIDKDTLISAIKNDIAWLATRERERTGTHHT